ncbi:hypothetical protein ACNOYE_39170 [Nannocystaceae bacterium ST9]
MAINYVILGARNALAHRAKSAGFLGKVILWPLWASVSVVYGLSHAVEAVLTITDAAEAMGVLEK